MLCRSVDEIPRAIAVIKIDNARYPKRHPPSCALLVYYTVQQTEYKEMNQVEQYEKHV